MIYPLIPKPQKITAGDTLVFTLTKYCEIIGEDKFPKAVGSLKKFLSESFSLELLGTGKEKLYLELSDEINSDEGYTLSVKEKYYFPAVILAISSAKFSSLFWMPSPFSKR